MATTAKRYTTTEAAEKIGVSRVTVHRYIQKGAVRPDRMRDGTRMLTSRDIATLKKVMGRT